jgi:hypothetical protein
LQVETIDSLLLELLPDDAQVTAIAFQGNDAVVARRAACLVVARVPPPIDGIIIRKL